MIDSQLEDGILTLRMARPPVNAFDTTLVAALDAELHAAKEKGAEAIILTGRPGMFSAGLDVPHLLGLDTAKLHAALTGYFTLCSNIARSPIPICCAISGHSPAGGAVVAIHTDYRIMSEGKYKIGLNETAVGLALPEHLYRAMVYVVGLRQAERLVVPGMLVSGEEALKVGLIDELVPPEQLETRAKAWCRTLLELPRTAMLENRAMCRRILHEAANSFEISAVQSFVERWQHPDTLNTLMALAKKLGK